MKPSQFVLEPIPFKGCDFDTWEVRPYDKCPCQEHSARSWKVEVIADDSNSWVHNGLRFKSKAAAEEWGADLFMRWTAVREWRVTESDEEPNR